MNERISGLVERLHALEAELEAEFSRRREELGYRIERRKVRFEEEAAALQRRLKKNLLRFILDARPATVLTSPAIYAMIVPLAFLDLMLSLYQAVCFPAYGIPKVDRSKYIALDRGRLKYLNLLEKLNCDYCGYANGLIAYAREIAGRTEQYFCPIKHALKVSGAHPRYPEFLDYGDAAAYRKELQGLRDKLRTELDA